MLDGTAITSSIMASTTAYFAVFAPIFLFMGGLLLSVVAIFILLKIFFPKINMGGIFDEADEE